MRVGARAGALHDLIGDVVDDVTVVAEAAPQVSMPAPPLRMLLAPLPVRMLASVLPVPLIAAAPGQGQVLDIGAEREAHRAVHPSVPAPAASIAWSGTLSTT